jgi:hypothetical protein
MAEIRVEKRKPIWPWLVAALAVVILLIYFLAIQNGEEYLDTAVATENTPTLLEVKENNSTIQSFVSFIESDTNRMTLDHEFTNTALLRLTRSIEAAAEIAGYNIRADLDKVREYAENITVNPYVGTHADDIRRAADELSSVLRNIQQAGYPELSSKTEDLHNAAASIDPDVLTLQQKDKVKAFFAEAAELLEEMN